MLNGSMKRLHEDVVIHILLELPVKSLMRFKSISKILYTLIHSSIFINLHRNRRTTSKDEFIIFKRSIKLEANLYKGILCFLSCNDDDTLNHVSPDIYVPHLSANFCCQFDHLLGSCHGLIALTDIEQIILLNPTTRKYRLLPCSPFVCPKDFNYFRSAVGFGYDSVDDDYKVVRFYELYSEPYERDLDARHSKVEVYDFCIDTWRYVTLTVKLLPMVHRSPNSEALFRGACHWTAQADGVPLILCFDLSSEAFRNMKMPDTCHFGDDKGYGLTVCQNSLTLICYPHPEWHIDPGQGFTDIWLIKEYGVNGTWIKKYSIRSLPIESSLAIWKDRVLLLQTVCGTLSSYDINSDKLKEFNFQGCRGTLRLLVYNEALTVIPRERKDGTEVHNF